MGDTHRGYTSFNLQTPPKFLETFARAAGSSNARCGAGTMKKQAALQRLARVEGQVRGVAKMVEQDRYCIAILNQAMETRVAVSQVEILILQGTAADCVEEALSAGAPEDQRRKFREMMEVCEND